MGSIVSVVSGKGGVGKSTLAAGIATQLCLRGRRVLLVDTDCGLSTIEYVLAHTAAAVYHAGDVLAGTVSLSQAVVRESGRPDFLAAQPAAFAGEDVPSLARLVTGAAQDYDFVLVDRPAGLDCALEQHLDSFRALIVSQPDPMAVRGAAAVCRALAQAPGLTQAVTVFNRFVPAYIERRVLQNLEALCDQIGARLLGVVPEDPRALPDVTQGNITPAAPYAKAMARIAARLDGENVPLPKLKKLFRP